MRERALITGMASVSSSGHHKDLIQQTIKERRYTLKEDCGKIERCRITQVGFIDRSLPILKKYQSAGTSSTLALFPYVAEQALKDAGMAVPCRADDHMVILLGSNYGFPVPYWDLFNVRNTKKKSPENSVMKPMFQLHFREDSITRCLQEYLGCSIEKMCVNMQCTSSLFALMLATARIRSGEITRALVGGYDFFEPTTYWVMQMAGLIDGYRAVPFSKQHNGFNYGEGLAFLVLENEKAAQKRGVWTSYGEVRGCAVNCRPADGESSISGIIKTIEDSLALAGLGREDIDFISPHGCGVPDMDNAESAAFKRCFGNVLKDLPMANYTPFMGYSFAASGILDLIVVLEGIKQGSLLPGDIPDTLNEMSDFNFFRSPVEAGKVRNLLKLKMAYSGSVASLIISTENTSIQQPAGENA